MSRRHSIGYNILALIVYFCAPFVGLLALVIEGLIQVFWVRPIIIWRIWMGNCRKREICNYLKKQIKYLEKQNDKRRNKR
jgi:hypothetical protein